MVMDVSQVFLGDELGVPDIKEIGSVQQIHEVGPLFDIGGHIGGISVVGLLEQRKCGVGTDRQRPNELFEVLTMLLAVAEGDMDAFRGFCVVISIN